MSWNSNDDETTLPENHHMSNQSQAIYSAMRKADVAMAQAGYASRPGHMRGAAVSRISESDTSTGKSSSNAGNTTLVTTDSGPDPNALLPKAPAHPAYPGTPSVSTQRSQSSLDLRKNDIQFHVIANLILSMYKKELDSGAASFSLSVEDKRKLDRLVSRDSFVDAVRFRLQNCPEDSQNSIHVICRQCRALGLHREGSQNLLYAPAGTVISIETASRTSQKKNDLTTNPSINGGSESLARQQLLAELREASNLMAESVTPEAAQFWRKHVVDLQTQLRALHEPVGPLYTLSGELDQRLGKSSEAPTIPKEQKPTYVPPNPEKSAPQPKQQDVPNSKAQYRPPAEDTGPAESTREHATNTLDPELQGLPMVDVVAPSNLPEGYTFEAEIDNKRFIATVPAGGVRKGKTFTCYMRDLEKVDSDIPVGRWRDGLFDFFAHGKSHPMVLNSILCPLVALAQVMTRMGLDFTGQPGRDIPRKGLWSAWGMIGLIICFWVILNAVVLFGLRFKYVEDFSISGADIASIMLVNVGMYAYVVYAVSNTRAFIRNKYLIRETCCRDLEDIVLSSVCMPCTISQMGRHTASYEEHPGHCCSDSGLPPGVEADLTTRRHTGSYRLW